MKKLDFASIPKFCISIKNSPRRKPAEDEFLKFGIHNVTFFNATNKRDIIVPELSPKHETDHGIADGILACAISHIRLIKYAKELNMPAICIFEDDVIFADDFKERIRYLETLDIDFDFLSLGGHFEQPDIKHVPMDPCAIKQKEPYIYKVFKQGGTYAYIITQKMYDFVIRNWNYIYGIDQFYSDHTYKRFNCYAFVPFLCACRGCESEITGSSWVYKNIGWFYQQDALPKLIADFKKPVDPAKTQTKATNLLDCTFITAVKIESKDREFNFLRVIQFICDNFATNIIIKESDTYNKVIELLPRIDKKECNIIAHFEKNESGVFHRTRLLNEALDVVKTPVTINYDIDVFMLPEAYVAARDKVLSGYDLVYPYKQGDDIQIQVSIPEHVKENYNGQSLFNREWQKPWQSYCGHVQFFNTLSYIKGGMENEEMISYGPEDRERCERFQRFGYKVVWLDACVYHIEHSRDENSSTKNPHFGSNDALMNTIRNMTPDQLEDYYKNVSYLNKYKNYAKA